jgi:hypothetical protein
MKRPVWLIVVGALVTAPPLFGQHGWLQARYWRYSSVPAGMPRTGQRSVVHSAACGQGTNGIKAAEVVARIGPVALDQYFHMFGVATNVTGERIGALGPGYAVSTTFVPINELVPNAEDREWLVSRGVDPPEGDQTCATACVVYPTAEASRLSVWGCHAPLVEGVDVQPECGTDGWDGNGIGVWNLSHAEAGTYTVSCMTGKNWSTDPLRSFWVVATDVHPVTGQPLNKVYR